jgi:hypothetical protein
VTCWRKASASDATGQCVEVRADGDDVLVRDSKAPDGGTLRLTRAQFAGFLGGCVEGQFDDLA